MKLLRKLMRKASENEVVDMESESGKLARTILFRIVTGTGISEENREAEMMKNMVEESDLLVAGVSGADEAVKWAMVELINHPDVFRGKRSCPGSLLSLALLNTAIAPMVQCFDFEVNGGKIKLEARSGNSMTLSPQLQCCPVVHFSPFDKK
ncbi:hypothetical protein Pint_24063 [Pistacia integerrima]|uniref:Uncharacterized protein n=1 Tax=Pistacia integerrima TaxID=434235 RepID=A0ACC0YHD2_9ROSI|nr:hypothetical protein Pint_24063 [Pistacia integerrima]